MEGGLLPTQHACLSAGEDAGGDEEAAGRQTGQTQAAAAGGAGPPGQRAGGVAAKRGLAGGKDPGAVRQSEVGPRRAKETGNFF